MTLWTMLFGLFGCPEPELGTDGAPAPSPFESCDPQEIELLAKKHGFMLAFEPCGSNLFQEYNWSTDGHRLYFLLGMTHHVMDAASKQKTTRVVPVPTPIGSTTWISATKLVLPIAPPDGSPEDTPPRLVVYDAETEATLPVDLPGLSAPSDLSRGTKPDRVLLSAVKLGIRKVFEVDLTSGEITEPFPWLGPVDNFTYTAAGSGLVATTGQTVTLYDPMSGNKRGLWAPATRGTLHPGGRWLMLEHLGEPVSVFQPVGIEELPEEDRELALQKAKKRADDLPDGYQRTVQPPMLSFVDTTTGRRYLLTSMQGTRFQWYETQDFYGSFLSWGFEQKQFRRNVLLGNFANRLMAAADGRPMLGLRPLSAPPAADPAGEASEGSAAP